MLAAAAVQVRAGQRPEIPQFEGEQIRKDGTQIYTQTVGVPLLDETGRPSGFQGITRDITERKQIEAELRVSLTKYSVLFDTAPIGISLTDDAGQLIEGNREAEQILGISHADQLRRTYDGPE
jgi:PAS domain-containing protein